MYTDLMRATNTKGVPVASKSYEAWFQEVEAAFVKLTGLSTADVPDYSFYDDYEDFVTPGACAKRCLRNAHTF